MIVTEMYESLRDKLREGRARSVERRIVGLQERISAADPGDEAVCSSLRDAYWRDLKAYSAIGSSKVGDELASWIREYEATLMERRGYVRVDTDGIVPVFAKKDTHR